MTHSEFGKTLVPIYRFQVALTAVTNRSVRHCRIGRIKLKGK